MLTVKEIANVIEGILFLSPKPVGKEDISKHLHVEMPLVDEAFSILRGRHSGGGLEVYKTSGGYELVTRKEYVEHHRAFFGEMDKSRLSRAALETLAVVAYKQPVTRSEIETIRGVNSTGTVRSLLDKGLIKISGKSENLGRAFLFSTTPEFLTYLGMQRIEDLPPFESFEKKV
jgi:segregation and condensation protein B